jgi:maltokinase
VHLVGLEPALLKTAAGLGRIATELLPTLLPVQRWFPAKGRTLLSIDLARLQTELEWPDDSGLFLATCHFADGGSERFFLPLAVVSEECGAVYATDGPWMLVDALALAGVRDRLLASLRGSGTAAFRTLSDQRVTPTRLAAFEQSNSALLFGDGAFVKIYRRAVAGPNPEVELLRLLEKNPAFDNAPRFYGSLEVRLPGEAAPAQLAVATELLAEGENGWELALDAIGKPGARDFFGEIGAATAALHAELRSTEEPIDRSDMDRLVADVRALHTRCPVSLPPLTETVLDCNDTIDTGARQKARLHGDYHLGQLLRMPNGRWVILDFEGEPGRTLDERCAKDSPLRDVAGMIRSIGYAAATQGVEEQEAVAGFLEGYNRISAEPVSVNDPLLRLYTLQKALYEVMYEINNRPDRVTIPMTAVKKLLER